MISIFTITYNEEKIINFFIDHYRSRFPNCNITVYDNMSDDQTVNFAVQQNCTVIPYDTNNTLQDSRYLAIKNNCWKDAPTDWVLVCDVDELLDINEEQLKQEESYGTTIVKGEGYNMVNMEDNFDFPSIKTGVRAVQYDKCYLFNKKYITDILYMPGCHACSPKGIIKYNTNSYLALHYKWLNPDYVVERYRLFASRLSEENKINRWGYHYNREEELLRIDFKHQRDLAQTVIL